MLIVMKPEAITVRRAKRVAILLMILFAVVSVSSSAISRQEKGKVKGIVTDANGARVELAVLTFENGNEKFQAKTNEAGEYEIELPIRIYQVKVTALAFCPTQVKVEVKPSAPTHMDFALKVTGSHNPCGGYTPTISFRRTDESEKVYAIEIGYEDGTNWFEFTAETTDDWYEYKKFRNIKVVLRFDRYSIRANKISLHRFLHRIKADGDVVVEDGKTVTKANYAQLDYTKSDPVIRLRK